MSQPKRTPPPWVSGPGEILNHGVGLLKNDSDTNRRLAMICIDNAVELTAKTFLGLPKRITQLQISRKELDECTESFPRLLDALEKYAADRLEGIDLGEVEWYHRLRNQLYHQGNGLTVERDKVEIYAALAKILFSNLFGFELVEPEPDGRNIIGSFLTEWVQLEKLLNERAKQADFHSGRSTLDVVGYLQRKGDLLRGEGEEIQGLRRLRNDVVHARGDYHVICDQEAIGRTRRLVKAITARWRTSD